MKNILLLFLLVSLSVGCHNQNVDKVFNKVEDATLITTTGKIIIDSLKMVPVVVFDIAFCEVQGESTKCISRAKILTHQNLDSLINKKVSVKGTLHTDTTKHTNTFEATEIIVSK